MRPVERGMAVTGAALFAVCVVSILIELIR